MTPVLTRKVRFVLAAAAVGLIATQLAAASGGRPLPIGAYTTKGAWSFVSAPRLHPPRITATGHVQSRALARGLFLVATLPNLSGPASRIPLSGQGGPLVLDTHLDPVWLMPVGTHLGAANLQQQSLDGKPVLTWWQGTLNAAGGTATGEDVVVNQAYRRVATLRASAPWVISEHDMVITPPHDAWVTVYRYVKGQNLSRFHGPASGTVYDVGVQEYDLSTHQLLNTWDAMNPGGSPNIPLSDSVIKPERGVPWDAYHINSVQPMGSGQFLVSLRNTSGVYLIDQSTGHVVWKLGGDPHKPSTFKLAAGARFAFQHDVRLGANRLTMFDDACCAVSSSGKATPPIGPSRGLVLTLNFANHTAKLARQYVHHPALHTFFLGSTQILPNHNVLVGWGSYPSFTEFSASGRTLLDATFPGAGKDIDYRALFTPNWVGTPYYPPSAVLRRKGSAATVYVSWNGATQVARWDLVLAATGNRRGKSVAIVKKAGFETAIHFRAGGSGAYRVLALDATGHTIGAAPVRTH